MQNGFEANVNHLYDHQERQERVNSQEMDRACLRSRIVPQIGGLQRSRFKFFFCFSVPLQLEI